ncbi:hypothetical protein RBB50_006287 [Rhinocladiella similis]
MEEDYAEIRTLFSQELSTMYKLEVPLYGGLLEAADQLERLHLDRHGATRLGSSEEMAIMARFLRIMGMYPVGYYDLAQAALPVHATCFRTLDMASLLENPSRLFVSLLRPSLLPDDMCDKAREVVSRRNIIDDRVLQLIEKAEKNALRLTRLEAADFITYGIATFKWHASSVVSIEEYQSFASQASLLADIVCFRGPHINHLTPRMLDIDRAQEMMKAREFPAKAVIEGFPRRKCPILLRKTSFKALEERINFIQADGSEGVVFCGPNALRMKATNLGDRHTLQTAKHLRQVPVHEYYYQTSY